MGASGLQDLTFALSSNQTCDPISISSNKTYRLFKVNTSELISTLAGDGVPGFSGDGGPANEARFNGLYGIAVDRDKNIYLADSSNHRIRVCSYYLWVTAETAYLASMDGECNLELFNDGTAAWTHKSGIKKYFDADGFQTATVNRNNNNTTYEYQDGKLSKITDPVGQETTFIYGTDGLLDSITNPAGTTLFDHDANGNLISITDPDTAVTTYAYNDPNHAHLLTDKTGPNNETTFYTYNAHGQMENVQAPTGETRNYTPADSIGLLNDLPIGEGTKAIPATPTPTQPSVIIDGEGHTRNFETGIGGVTTGFSDALGNTMLYSRDELSRITKITEPNGNQTSMTYDEKGNLLSQTEESLGATTSYTYTANFNRTESTTDPLGNTTFYEYDTNGNLVNVIDAQGNTTTNTYYANGLVATKTDALGNVTTYDYDPVTWNLTSVTDTNLGETINTYDAAGNILTKTDPNGNTTTYSYDEMNRVISVTDARGGITSYTYSPSCGCPYGGNGKPTSKTDAEGRITTFEYDGIGQLIKETDPLGGIKSYTYDNNRNKETVTDAIGNVTSYAYDAANRLISETDAMGNTTSYEYDAMGNRTKRTDAAGKITYFQYDDMNRLIMEIKKVGDTSPTPDSDDAVTEYTYDLNDNRTGITDPNGNTTTYSYDGLNRQTQMINALGESEQYSYDAIGNKITVTSPNGNVTNYVYDVLKRLTAVSDLLGTVANFTYDAAGNRLSETDADGNITTNSYDALNRLIRVTDPMGEYTDYEYDNVGNRTRVTDREGNISTYSYDALNRLIQEVQDSNGLNISTAYEYDAVGNRIKITDDQANVTTYTYDGKNRVTQETYADATMAAYTYDGVGNRITRTDQNGNITHYSYNDLHQLVLRDYPGSNDEDFSYDPGGRMVSASNLNSMISFSYDDINRLIQQVQNGQVISYVYNTAARTRQITYPGGRTITETTDLRGSMDTVGDGGNVIADYTNDGARVNSINYLNGITTTYSYNANNWVTHLAHYNGATQIAEFGYGFDKEGNRKYSERFHDPDHSEQYIYDNIYRLADFARGTLDAGKEIPVPVTQTAYTLDRLGNWDSKNTDGITQTRNHNMVNEITDIDGANFAYDNNGNLTDDTTNTYEYDYENRLTRVTRNSDSQILVEFKYDALSRRIEKNNPITGKVTKYYLDGGRVIEEQESGSSNNTFTYVYGNGIDEILEMEVNGTTNYYYHPNSLGSIDALTDSSGNIVEYYRYDAYGEVMTITDPGADTIWFTGDDVTDTKSSVGNPYLFTGRRWDEETGLYYYRARYYSPTLGRFLQQDPQGYVDGMNLYEYVKSNPIKYTDPYGLSALDILLQVLRFYRNILLNAYQQRLFWRLIADYYMVPKGLKLSAFFLKHSLQDNPGDFEDFKDATAQIKASSEYENAINGIDDGEWEDYKQGNDIGFGKGDLYSAFRNVRFFYKGCKKGSIHFLDIYIRDTYDFSLTSINTKDWFYICATIGANFANISEALWAINDFKIHIYFSDNQN